MSPRSPHDLTGAEDSVEGVSNGISEIFAMLCWWGRSFKAKG
jgi:hypothetical protein